MKLTGPQQDRAAGLLVGLAVGDAHSRIENSGTKFRRWGATTVLAQATANALGKSSHVAAAAPPDVLAALVQPEVSQAVKKSSHWYQEASSLSFPFGISVAVALTTLANQPRYTFELARTLANFMPEKHMAEACGLWSAMLADAVRSGEADLESQFLLLDNPKTKSLWLKSHFEAQVAGLGNLEEADYPVSLVMQAWSFVRNATMTPGPGRFAEHLSPEKLAILPSNNLGPLIGSTIGAARGFSSIPFAWRRDLTGPNMGGSADQMMRQAITIGCGTDLEPNKWPNVTAMKYTSSSGKDVMATHPSDTATMVGGIGNLHNTSLGAVISLCRIGTGQRPEAVKKRDHATFWLVDSDKPQDNPNLSFVLDDAARTAKMFRDEDKRVLIHCVGATSRTPTVAALYGRLVTGKSAWEEFGRIMDVLPTVTVNPAYRQEMLARPTARQDPARPAEYRHPDRSIIELITWSVAAELLRLYPDAWIDGPTGDSGAQAKEFVVMFDLQRYVGFRRDGGGIATGGGFIASWPQAVGWGGPQRVVASLEERLRLQRPPTQPTFSVGARLARFAAAVVRMTYGLPGFMPPTPRTRWNHAYAPGRQPSAQILHLDLQGHHVEADQDSVIRVDGTEAFRLPYTGEEIDAVAFQMLDSLDLTR